MFYVMVDPNSKYEKLLGIATMAPYFVICGLVVLMVRCRELMTITWLVGQLGNEVGFRVQLWCSSRVMQRVSVCGGRTENPNTLYIHTVKGICCNNTLCMYAYMSAMTVHGFGLAANRTKTHACNKKACKQQI
jgi:hypothetical protein